MKALLVNVLVLIHLIQGRKFKVRRGTNTIIPGTNRFIGVFGIKIVSQQSVCDKSLQYAANVLAQLIDSNQNGTPDDGAVTAKLLKSRATLLLVTDNGLNQNETPFNQVVVVKDCKSPNIQKQILVAIVELLAKYGISPAYPHSFGTKHGSLLRESLDFMVGDCGYAYDDTLKWPKCSGHVFYNNTSCNIECLATKYLTSLMTTVLGIVPAAFEGKFWDIRSKADLMKYDSRGYSLIKQFLRWIPVELPDGIYRPGLNGYRIARLTNRLRKGSKKNHYWKTLKNKLIEIRVS